MENVDLLISDSHSKLPLGHEPPLPSACHMRYQVSFTKDLSRVDLDLPEGLLVGLGYAATSREPARLPTGAECGREIGSRKPAPLEFNDV